MVTGGGRNALQLLRTVRMKPNSSTLIEHCIPMLPRPSRTRFVTELCKMGRHQPRRFPAA